MQHPLNVGVISTYGFVIFYFTLSTVSTVSQSWRPRFGVFCLCRAKTKIYQNAVGLGPNASGRLVVNGECSLMLLKKLCRFYSGRIQLSKLPSLLH